MINHCFCGPACGTLACTFSYMFHQTMPRRMAATADTKETPYQQGADVHSLVTSLLPQLTCDSSSVSGVTVGKKFILPFTRTDTHPLDFKSLL